MTYVDDGRMPFHRMKMSHLIADSADELERLARLLGLRPAWKHGDHYDVGEGKRRTAIKLGAKPITCRELVKILRRRE